MSVPPDPVPPDRSPRTGAEGLPSRRSVPGFDVPLVREERLESFSLRGATFEKDMPPSQGAFRSWRKGLEWWRGFMWGLLLGTCQQTLGPTRYLLMATSGYWSSRNPAPTHDQYPTEAMYALMTRGREQMIAADTRWASYFAALWLIGLLMTLRLLFKREYRSEGITAMALALGLLVVGLILRARVG